MNAYENLGPAVSHIDWPHGMDHEEVMTLNLKSANPRYSSGGARVNPFMLRRWPFLIRRHGFVTDYPVERPPGLPELLQATGTTDVREGTLALAQRAGDVWRCHEELVERLVRLDLQDINDVTVSGLDLSALYACDLRARVAEARRENPDYRHDEPYSIRFWEELPSTTDADLGWLALNLGGWLGAFRWRSTDMGRLSQWVHCVEHHGELPEGAEIVGDVDPHDDGCVQIGRLVRWML